MRLAWDFFTRFALQQRRVPRLVNGPKTDFLRWQRSLEEYDSCSSTVCLDEKLVELHADVQPVVPVAPGQPERGDDEYERRGTRNLFVMVEPLDTWRQVEGTEQRTMQDDAQVVRWLVDEVSPQAEFIRLVQDHLNTHPLRRSPKHFRLPKQTAFCNAWSFISSPSTTVG